MGRLRDLSKQAHEIFLINVQTANKTKEINTTSRYVESVVYFKGIFDKIIFDRKLKRFMVELALPKGKAYSIGDTDIVMSDGLVFKRFLIRWRLGIINSVVPQ